MEHRLNMMKRSLSEMAVLLPDSVNNTHCVLNPAILCKALLVVKQLCKVCTLTIPILQKETVEVMGMSEGMW